MEKHGGRLMLGAHVESVLHENGRAAGVKLRGGGTVRATKAVVSNASVWDTVRLLPPGVAPQKWTAAAQDTPACRSFMHLHLGIDATGGGLVKGSGFVLR